MASGTLGTTIDICDKDWATTMSELGLRVSGLNACFGPLESAPTDRKSVTAAVTVNGNPFDAGAAVYDPISNGVCFKTTPPVGATIVVTWK